MCNSICNNIQCAVDLDLDVIVNADVNFEVNVNVDVNVNENENVDVVVNVCWAYYNEVPSIHRAVIIREPCN